jgi:hypothetical protein
MRWRYRQESMLGAVQCHVARLVSGEQPFEPNPLPGLRFDLRRLSA